MPGKKIHIFRGKVCVLCCIGSENIYDSLETHRPKYYFGGIAYVQILNRKVLFEEYGRATIVFSIETSTE